MAFREDNLLAHCDELVAAVEEATAALDAGWMMTVREVQAVEILPGCPSFFRSRGDLQAQRGGMEPGGSIESYCFDSACAAS